MNESDGFLGLSPPLASLTGYSFYNYLDQCVGQAEGEDCNFSPPAENVEISNNIKSIMLSIDMKEDPETKEPYDETYQNWEYLALLQINEVPNTPVENIITYSEDNYQQIGQRFSVSERQFNATKISESITPEELEAGTYQLNYDFPIRSVRNIDISLDTIVASKDLPDDTTIDMTQQGLHMDKGLLKYLSEQFLQIQCTNSSATVNSWSVDKNQSISQTQEVWTCPCTVTDVSSLPNITMLLWQEQDSPFYSSHSEFSFEAKNYFTYPFYDERYTLPSTCNLLIQSSDR